MIASNSAGPHRDRDDEDAGDAGADVLLRPHDERIPPASSSKPTIARVRTIALTWEWIAERAGDREQDEAATRNRRPANRNGGSSVNTDLDREVRRAPEDADDQIGNERLAFERRPHQSGSVGMKPGFSNNVDNNDRRARVHLRIGPA